jgi:hypothetical protein
LKVAPLTAWNSLRPKTPLRSQKLFVSAVASMITGASGSFALPACRAAVPLMWSSITIRRGARWSSDGRQASSARV